jgi:hypothetical protein
MCMKKQILQLIVLCSLIVACNSQPSIEETVDSTSKAVDTQRAVTRDSVTFKSDSSRKTIDSAYSRLKDSLNKTR